MIKLNELKQILNQKKVLVFTNKNSFSLYKNYFESEFNASITYYKDFQLNPKLSDVIECFKKININDFDAIIGIGGGSPMDFSKAVTYFSHFEISEYNDFLKHLKSPKQFESNLPLYLIPTTSGSGSEGNRFSVIYDEAEKYSLVSSAIYPKNIVLDSKFVEFLPKRVTAYTAIDAITHALESFWANGSTIDSQKISLKALNILVPNIKEVVHNPTAELREKIMFGAYLAGKAIDTAMTTAPHAFSYYLTTEHGIPHGQAVAINLGYFIEINGTARDLTPIHEVFQVKTDNELKLAWFKLLKDIEIYENPLDIVDDTQAFFDAVNSERLGNNPYPLKKSEFEKLFTGDN
ncbi:MAG: hypothetical protein CME65_04615 [Halobacteriovoraceae bacterium]|nr:hypothetical protein [Halobacteriovoraceae bacterium]|tara:strand:+ start:1232 stop:2278 length:1047 start_codon:yes stop_codon:yes gene_type:complete